MLVLLHEMVPESVGRRIEPSSPPKMDADARDFHASKARDSCDGVPGVREVQEGQPTPEELLNLVLLVDPARRAERDDTHATTHVGLTSHFSRADHGGPGPAKTM